MNEKPAPPFPALRCGEHPALDFLNTIATPKDEPVEWLTSGVALIGWLEEGGLLTAQEATRVRARATRKELERAFGEALELREWFRGLMERVKRRGLREFKEADAARVNGILARGPRIRRVERTKVGLRLETVRGAVGVGQLLVPVAEAMAELLCEADFELVRRCEGGQCTLWFYDRSKGHRRRWCSQAVCGNRAKVAAFRERLKK